MVYAKDTFLWWRLCIPSIRKIAYIAKRYMKKIPAVTRVTCAKCQKYNIYAIDLKLIFFFKFKWNVSKQINPNLGGFSRGSFLPLCSNETTSLKTMPSFELAYISCTLYMRLLWLISGLTKNLSRSKKV